MISSWVTSSYSTYQAVSLIYQLPGQKSENDNGWFHNKTNLALFSIGIVVGIALIAFIAWKICRCRQSRAPLDVEYTDPFNTDHYHNIISCHISIVQGLGRLIHMRSFVLLGLSCVL